MKWIEHEIVKIKPDCCMQSGFFRFIAADLYDTYFYSEKAASLSVHTIC